MSLQPGKFLLRTLLHFYIVCCFTSLGKRQNTIKVPHWYNVQGSDTTMMPWKSNVRTTKNLQAKIEKLPIFKRLATLFKAYQIEAAPK